MRKHSLFERNLEIPTKPNCIAEENIHKKYIPSTTFGILLLGNFVTNYDTEPAMNIFLKSASVTPIKNNSCYHIQRENDVSFNLMVLTDRLMHRYLISKTNMILILPNNVEDFDDCVDKIHYYEFALPKGIKIFYLNNFPEKSSEYSLIERKVAILNKTSRFNYELLDKSSIKSLIENPQKATLPPDNQKPSEESSSSCLIS